MNNRSEAARGLTRGLCELTLESLYFEDPEGNVVETWDFFEHSDGAWDRVETLTAGSEPA
jgi:catechol-2,3-dioxygenase